MSAAFSSDVPEAHAKFMDAAQAAGASCGAFENPERGPDGETLHMGFARLGPENASRVLLLTSGMHGIEGLVGSAMQIEYFRRMNAAAMPKDTAALVVHLVNPWGAAWDRRENEDNVDVFRNFLYRDQEAVDNPVYRELDSAINPTAWDGPQGEAAHKQLRDFIQREGIDGFVAAFRRGQTFNPKGMTYHGQGPVWSRRVFDRIVASELSQARAIVSVDVHSGFGEFGAGIVAIYRSQGAERLAFAERHYGALYTPGEDAIIPSHGSMPFDYISGMTGARIHSIGLEFGTYDLTTKLELFRELNYIFAYGDPHSKRGRALRAECRELFCPESAEWRRKALDRGEQVLEQAQAALQDWARPPATANA